MSWPVPEELLQKSITTPVLPHFLRFIWCYETLLFYSFLIGSWSLVFVCCCLCVCGRVSVNDNCTLHPLAFIERALSQNGAVLSMVFWFCSLLPQCNWMCANGKCESLNWALMNYKTPIYGIVFLKLTHCNANTHKYRSNGTLKIVRGKDSTQG